MANMNTDAEDEIKPLRQANRAYRRQLAETNDALNYTRRQLASAHGLIDRLRHQASELDTVPSSRIGAEGRMLAIIGPRLKFLSPDDVGYPDCKDDPVDWTDNEAWLQGLRRPSSPDEMEVLDRKHTYQVQGISDVWPNPGYPWLRGQTLPRPQTEADQAADEVNERAATAGQSAQPAISTSLEPQSNHINERSAKQTASVAVGKDGEAYESGGTSYKNERKRSRQISPLDSHPRPTSSLPDAPAKSTWGLPACSACRTARVSCDSAQPCHRCRRTSEPCHFTNCDKGADCVYPNCIFLHPGQGDHTAREETRPAKRNRTIERPRATDRYIPDHSRPEYVVDRRVHRSVCAACWDSGSSTCPHKIKVTFFRTFQHIAKSTRGRIHHHLHPNPPRTRLPLCQLNDSNRVSHWSTYESGGDAKLHDTICAILEFCEVNENTPWLTRELGLNCLRGWPSLEAL
ncbi:uncharacterized protein MYCGRDRAFT_91241 [Zymoseptoria tritici IPO323]|uniref:Zn(2)-C6 fungal-type domain-containing protein n=1 Tax=Zymoseptoria tritici (strain CBS 115943 / IPO323) TaxID=336722 RepID=F9X4U8_ZYMTI|nr:uncharacterized protein MYCGRDRAFT_91241 [Zymoseptoria tritici IPO323]EGP90236.1 hypothetical protein MYCGRDRAFT_91241 [Zymoseptoria tritici IPO323]